MNLKVALAGLVIAATLPMGAAAQQRSPNEWQWQAEIYAWLPTIGGKTGFPAPTGGSDINVSVNNILDKLKFTFMGTLSAQKGEWGMFTDVVYLNLGDTKNEGRDVTIGGSLPAGVTAGATLDLKATIWTLAANYRMKGDPASTVDVFGGFRYLNLQQDLAWQFTGNVDSIPVLNRSGRQSAKLSNTDAIVGVKGRASFGDGNRWFVPWYLDVGTGQSDLTWQGIVGVGYKYGWGDVYAVWRYLDYKMASGKKIEDLDANGGAIGVAFRW
jgi:hypothetical protein